MATVEFNDEGWDAVVQDVVENKCVPMMQRVATAANEADGLTGTGHDPKPGYAVGTEGGKPLEKHDYRATVITATNEAMYHNAVDNTLVKNFYQAGEE